MGAIVESPVWPRLTEFGISNSAIGGRAVQRLAAARPPRGLRRLTLNDYSIKSDDARVLAQSPILALVRELHLHHASICSAGVTALARSPHVAALRWLDVGFVGAVSPEAVRAIAQSPGLANLYVLFAGVLSKADSAAALLTHGRLRHLHVVYSHRSRLSPTLSRMIRARFGQDCLVRAAP